MAIVGAGIWGVNHARIYQSHPFCEVVALCDMNLERANQIAAEMGIPQVYQDYNECFEKSGCDAVAVVTPDHLHADVAVAAANHKKHVLIEKPLATTAEDVHRIVKAVRENADSEGSQVFTVSAQIEEEIAQMEAEEKEEEEAQRLKEKEEK